MTINYNKGFKMKFEEIFGDYKAPTETALDSLINIELAQLANELKFGLIDAKSYKIKIEKVRDRDADYLDYMIQTHILNLA